MLLRWSLYQGLTAFCYQIIQRYTDNTSGGYRKAKINEVWKVNRIGEVSNLSLVHYSKYSMMC